MQYSLNNSGLQRFCPLKIKITQFPSGFYLNVVCLSLSANNLENKERYSLRAQRTWPFFSFFLLF